MNIYTYKYRYTSMHTCIQYIHTIFVNEVPATLRPVDDPDLARFPGPLKIALTLARSCFWSFLDLQNQSILECQNQLIFIPFH